MSAFTGQLGANLIFSALYNMIISQEVFADNIAGTNSRLVDLSRVDGSMYGDTKLYYSTDVIASVPWGNDAEAANLLALHRPEAPQIQAIKLDVFRQCAITVDNYLTKQAWMEEGAFVSFNSIILGKLRECKRIYDATTFNAYLGTAVTNVGKQSQTIALSSVAGDAEKENKLRSMEIAEFVANMLIELEDVSRDYNDYGQLRSYDPKNLLFVWRAGAVNKINKMALPVIYHKDGVIDRLGEYILPDRYFGTVKTAAGTTSSSNVCYALVEKAYTVGGVTTNVFPGQQLPLGANYAKNEVYSLDDKVLFKVIDKRSIPFMSAFEAGTSFFNAKSLTENEYLTWGHNTLEYLKHYPLITVKYSVG